MPRLRDVTHTSWREVSGDRTGLDGGILLRGAVSAQR